MRAMIYGAGALGTVLGAYIARAGRKIDLVNRNAAHVAALREKGAHIVGKVDFVQKVSALLPSELSGQYDIIILMTKQQHNAEVIEFLKPFLKEDGALCTCQNGLPEPGISAVIGEERTYGCTIGWGATYISPGVSELTSAEDTFSFSLGRIGGGSDRNLETLKALLSHMGKAEIDPDFTGSRWSKLLINASFSALSAVTGLTFGGVASFWKTRRLAQLIMKECVDTAHALGVSLAPMQGKDVALIADYHSSLKRVFSFMIIPAAMRKHRSLRSSMLQDIEKGKPTEIEAVDGAAAAEGREIRRSKEFVHPKAKLLRLVGEVARRTEGVSYAPG